MNNIDQTELTYEQKLYQKRYLIGPITSTWGNQSFLVQYDNTAKIS